MDYTADWSYGGIAPDRSDHLRACPPYCELIRQLVDKAAKANIEFHLASPGNGLNANRYAFGKLERHLLLAAQEANLCTQDPNDSARELSIPEMELLISLRLASAKIWGDETEGELQVITTQKQDVNPQVIAPRWVNNAKYGSEKARKGIKTSRFKTLKFHGAFLKGAAEQVPLDKVCRSEDIHFWGFS